MTARSPTTSDDAHHHDKRSTPKIAEVRRRSAAASRQEIPDAIFSLLRQQRADKTAKLTELAANLHAEVQKLDVEVQASEQINEKLSQYVNQENSAIDWVWQLHVGGKRDRYEN